MSSGFISETELAERRRVRQEEWEKVRKPDQPTVAPEEEYDHRSLYERLQAQKQKKDLEYEEAHRLKNMIKGLDDDEVEFLDLVDRSKLEEERKKSLEEAREMAEFRSKVACLQEESLAERIQMEIRKPQLNNNLKNNCVTRSSQSKLLAGAVVKKRGTDVSGEGSSPVKRSRQSATTPDATEELEKRETADSANETCGDARNSNSTDPLDEEVKPINKKICEKHVKVGGMTCIGVLPGLGHYRTESSDDMDSDDSSDANEPDHPLTPVKFDLVGRKIKKKSCPSE